MPLAPENSESEKFQANGQKLTDAALRFAIIQSTMKPQGSS
jgi:hypothetical protein